MTELTIFADIKRALTLGPVFCDIAQPHAKGLPVRNVRRFNKTALGSTDTLDQNEWTSRMYQGLQKGYEVEVLEGWHVPEKVYVK